MKQRVRVLIADDHPHSRRGLRVLLATSPEVEVVGEATNGQQTLYLVEECQPDVVLMDVRMPVLDGLEAARIIKSRWPEVRVVLLTMHAAYQADARAAGADGFLLKGCSTENLLAAISSPRKPCHQVKIG